MPKKTTVIRFWGEDMKLPISTSHREVRRVFTRGQCHSLARALHQLTGWPLVIMCRSKKGNVREVGDHVVVRAPDGSLVDISGVINEAHWAWLPVRRKVREETVKKLSETGYWDEQSVEAAMPFAEKVLKALDKQRRNVLEW